jgi:hypothetical protein
VEYRTSTDARRPSSDTRPAGLERARRERNAVELADLLKGTLDRGSGCGIGDPAAVDREHQRRVRAAEGRRMRLKEIDRLL